MWQQAGHLIEAPEFSKSLIKVLHEEHDGGLHIEGAWLLAFLCGGSETHMHTMVKQGAANAAVRRLCSTLDKVIGHIITRTFYQLGARTSFNILVFVFSVPLV